MDKRLIFWMLAMLSGTVLVIKISHKIKKQTGLTSIELKNQGRYIEK